MIYCTKCNKSTNILKGLKALQDTDALFRVASTNLEEGRNEQALKAYLEILKLLDETLALPIRDYHLCQQGVRLCALALGNRTNIWFDYKIIENLNKLIVKFNKLLIAKLQKFVF